MELNNIVFKKAEKADAQSIARIEKICFPEAWSEEMILSAMENGTVYIGAYAEGECIGYAGANIVLDEGQVANIALDPCFRGIGLGRRLCQELIDYCFRNGCASITLEVRHTNAVARKLYTSLGFKEVGCRKNYYSSPAADAILMTLEKGEDTNG